LFFFQLGGGALGALAVGAVLAAVGGPQGASHTWLAVWIGYFTSWNLIPLSLMRVREEAGRHARISLAGTVLLTLGCLAFVVFVQRSAKGALLGWLASSALMGAVYAWTLRPDIALRFSLSRLLGILRYSVQFVPHSVGAWALNLSDRVVIEALLGRAAAGIYTAGYVLASGVSLVIEGIGNSWLTFFLKAQHDPDAEQRVAAVATRFVGVAALVGLASALFLPLFVRVTLPATYLGAEPVASLAALGLMLTAPYLVCVYAVMTVEALTSFPLVSLSCAAATIALNLWLVPRIGVVAAALTTIVGYAAQALLTGLVAARVRPIAHDYRRWAIALGTAFVFGLLPLASPRLPLALELAWRSAALLAAPAVLVASGYLRPDELAGLRQAARARS
jgi:O-antigen/teichoic acid export membrane protein